MKPCSKSLAFLTMLVLTVIASAALGYKVLMAAESEPTPEGVVNKLLGPGPLIEGHSNLEHGNCLKCHDAGQGVPDSKCLDCHTAIKDSIKTKNSFHASQAAANKACFTCHSDHKGRSFNSTKVDQNSFNHNLTGFKLKGSHTKVKCASCHTEKRSAKPVRKNEIRFFGKDDSCKGCHKKDDPHSFPSKFAAMECSACHNEVSWKEFAKFDHKKETGYELVGHHAKLKCASCHAPKGKPVKYKFPELGQSKCLTCHTDHHKDDLSPKFRGGQCDQCHAQTSWKISSFDHGITGFVLKGAHAKQACASCHAKGAAANTKPSKWKGLSSTCQSCHSDYHGFGKETSPKFGPLTQCAKCHNETSWRSALTFNHNQDTGFPITGKHIGVKCFNCHKPQDPSKKPPLRHYDFPHLAQKTCETCHVSPHKSTDPDIFRKNKCSSCHSTEGWRVFGNKGSGMLGDFNHNTMTRFPLTGDHAKLSCDTCHKKAGKQVYKFPSENKNFCISCHKTVHTGQFNEKFFSAACDTCHNTVDFKDFAKFDHNAARFQLTGNHTKIAKDCFSCHKPTAKKLPTQPPKVAHKFIFEHPNGGFCVDCHKNVHKNQFSSRFPADNCQDCHNTVSFANLLTFDHNKTRFKLTGEHLKRKDKCGECHVRTKNFLDTAPPKPAGKFQFENGEKGFCESCHKSVHKEQFSPKFAGKPCKECHTTIAFDKRLPFDHKTTDFALTGAHAKIRTDCGQCHVRTAKMLPTTPPKPAGKFLFSHQKTGFCESCHKSEHVGQFRKKFSSKPCQECHTSNVFVRRKPFEHKLTRFELKGKHLKVKCADCHVKTQRRFKAPPHHFKGRYIFADLAQKDCAVCHKDPHQGKFGPRCSECHSESGWEATAEFHKNFHLSGVHYLLDCNSCHQDNRRLSGMDQDCKMCHAKDDAHLGTQPNCQECHNQYFWQTSTFKHSLTGYPLRGVHRTLSCSECHSSGVYEGLVGECASCHFQDAQKVTTPDHKSGGFENCEQCHNSFSFSGK